MMDITSKLIEGVVSLTKLMAHGAMHEACLIEVIKTTEEEAFKLVDTVKKCVYGNHTDLSHVQDDVDRYIAENNATVLDIDEISPMREKSEKKKKHKSKKDKSNMNDIIRRMLSANKNDNLDPSLKNTLVKLQKELASTDTNHIENEIKGDK